MNKIPNITKKNHFIPQFILKNFCFNNHGDLYFKDINNDVRKCDKKYIFMGINLYKDKDKSNDNPYELEKLFSIYENEIANLFKNKIYDKNPIELIDEEERSLNLFFAIMSFRSVNVKNMFDNLSEDGKSMYDNENKDIDFNKLWKDNLKELLKCRSFEDVDKNEHINKNVKTFMLRDTYGISGKYFVFFETRGNSDFVISDCYPLNIYGVLPSGIQLNLISYFPIKPNFLIALVNNGAIASPTLYNLKNVIKPPKRTLNGWRYNLQKIYEPIVRDINNETKKHYKIGYVFKSKERNLF